MREDINTADLVDIRNVAVDINLPKHERIAEFIRQIKDPYLYKCGKFTITERHPLTGLSFEDCLYEMMA
jgi:hypothetical protein